MNLYMAGIDFQCANLAVREPVSLVQGQVEALLPKIRAFDGVLGGVLLATCNRTELYLHTAHNKVDPLFVLTQAIGVAYDIYTPIAVVRKNEDTVRHLMEVASGLQSQIFGDDQILSQVRAAIATSRKLNCADNVLHTLFRHAVTSGKRVKTETRLIGVPTSAAHRGVEMAKELLGSLHGTRAVVIGNGEMGRLAATLLYQDGCDVTITLRTYRHGETIVPAGCKTHAYDDRLTIIDGADLVISATTSPHFTLTYEQLKALQIVPQLIIDLAMPRDIDEAARALTKVLNLDDLGQLADENAEERKAAHQILEEEQAEFQAWYEYRKALPLIAEIKDTAVERVKYDHAFPGLYAEGDLDGLTELAVHKTIDMLLGGMKEILTAAQVQSCLTKMQKGNGK